MKHLLACAALILLSSCAEVRSTPEPIIRTVEVKVPVDDPACAIALLERLRERPAYPDTDEALSSAEIFEAVQLLLAGRKLRSAREQALLSGVEACAGQ